MDRFTKQIHAIVADREHGSSTLLQWILDALSGEDGTSPTRSQQRWALAELRRIDRSMVVVHHLLDTLGTEPGDDLPERVRAYARQWSDIPARVARQLLSVRDWHNALVLLHSHSGMLLSAIEHVHKSAPDMHFWQTRSLPGEEGVSQYRRLQDRGVACELVDDGDAPGLASSIDAVWLGVDQFDAQCFVNKVGSEPITRAMTDAANPVFVLGDSRKQVRQVQYSTALFEAVPFARGVHLVTERGVFQTVSGTNNFS
ncbi:hypothetical protein [Marinobacter zhanjiangensis]|uniref:Uncharacterized protein n=1 Tax=Marinobacter zhanjiangensis TaxID=578215 RepID=A0ABQ3B819_9GAMM|nr:hypothetical protein [Marinobacter zhanjiangensis]GGY82676.1 hypothetical protein GCM10007071_32710 [Marinobacter zhanjiangensis]